MDKVRIREAVVVEGRDDAAVVSRAVNTLIIITHGFGISQKTWELLDKAYAEKGLIILTDPDYSGEVIRKRLTEKYPDAKQAYLARKLAISGDDIGIENARSEDVAEALRKTRWTSEERKDSGVTRELLNELGLIGKEGSKALREAVANELSIGDGNGKAFLKKLNDFGITLEELTEAVKKVVRSI